MNSDDRAVLTKLALFIKIIFNKYNMQFSFFLNFNLFLTVIALSVWIVTSGGCVDMERTVSVGVGLSGQHCTRPLDKCV